MQRVAALRAAPDDQVGRPGQADEPVEVAEVELQVCVGQQRPGHLRRGDARAQGGAIAQVASVDQDAHGRIALREDTRAIARSVTTAVVDHDDFVAHGHAARGHARLVDCLGDVVDLVETGQDDGEPWQLIHCTVTVLGTAFAPVARSLDSRWDGSGLTAAQVRPNRP